MPTVLTRVLIACFFALPPLVFGADIGAELKSTPPAQTAVAAPKPASAVQTARIGYVDIARIAAESERGKELKALLTRKKDQAQGKIEGKKNQIDKLKSSIEVTFAKMTPKQREAKSKEFQKKVEEFQKFARASEDEFLALQDKETGTFYEAIEQAAVAHGKANGFAAIAVKKEMLYTSSSVDAQEVTDDLIKALNLGGQKK